VCPVSDAHVIIVSITTNSAVHSVVMLKFIHSNHKYQYVAQLSYILLIIGITSYFVTHSCYLFSHN